MNLKQVFSVAAAAGLPALALCGYMYVAPTRALAQSNCPDGEQYSPAPNAPPGYCAEGAGGSVAPGTHGYFVFCPNFPGGGTCEAGQCVLCDD